ncbi:MAG: hypothetical protein RXR52_44210 [Paraburkholderia sp.]
MAETPVPRSITVTHTAVLDALRHVRQRQVVRYRHGRVLDALHALGLIEWTREPVRVSQQQSSPDSAFYHAPAEVAQLTAAGRSTFARLISLEDAPGWAHVARTPFRGFR